MVDIFKPDVFSNSAPLWTVVGDSVREEITKLLNTSFIPDQNQIKSIASSGAFEINSNNLMITLVDGSKYLVKRWSSSAETKEIQKTLDLMQWLAEKDLPILPAIKGLDGGTIIQFNGSCWSIFPFNEGNYFSGAGNELELTARVTGKLTKLIKNLPEGLRPSQGPSHLTDADDAIMDEMDRNQKNWQDILDVEHAALLQSEWKAVKSYWDFLRSADFYSGAIQPIHFDLHPHNILIKANQVAALLDFESCKTMPIGFGLAFNALKQCRQAVVLTNENPSKVGNKYLDILYNEFPDFSGLINNFDKLAASEVMRRLCVIFTLNLKEGKRTWNHVLPIQLGHLKEAKILFGELR